MQTYNKDHYAIKHAINQDYDSFFNQEMKIRKLAKYIPFYNITQIEFRHQDYAKCFLYAEEVKLKLKKMFDKEEVIILGPVSPVVRRVNDKFIVRILVKYKVLPKLDETLKELYTEYTDKDVLISIDRFPTSY